MKRDTLFDTTHYRYFLDAFVDAVKIADVEQMTALSERFVSLNNLHGNIHQLDLERYACLLTLGHYPKMNAYLKAEGFDTLHILHNNSYSVEGYAICGTRGWLFDVGEPHDEKVMNREIGRLRMSLQAAEPGLEKLVFLHYPPVYTGTSAPEIVATLKEFGIKTCFYGHLHGNAIRFAVQGEVDGIRYKLVSADGLRFCPYRIN